VKGFALISVAVLGLTSHQAAAQSGSFTQANARVSPIPGCTQLGPFVASVSCSSGASVGSASSQASPGFMQALAALSIPVGAGPSASAIGPAAGAYSFDSFTFGPGLIPATAVFYVAMHGTTSINGTYAGFLRPHASYSFGVLNGAGTLASIDALESYGLGTTYTVTGATALGQSIYALSLPVALWSGQYSFQFGAFAQVFMPPGGGFLGSLSSSASGRITRVRWLDASGADITASVRAVSASGFNYGADPTVAPEPATWVMLATGFLALAAIRRRLPRV